MVSQPLPGFPEQKVLFGNPRHWGDAMEANAPQGPGTPITLPLCSAALTLRTSSELPCDFKASLAYQGGHRVQGVAAKTTKSGGSLALFTLASRAWPGKEPCPQV